MTHNRRIPGITTKGTHHMELRNARKLAISALALGGATTAIVFGSWAAWTAQTANPGNTVKTGNLGLTTDKPATHVFSVDKVKPGDAQSHDVTVKNEGSVPLALKLSQLAVIQGAGAALQLQISDGTDCVYPAKSGACGSDYAAWNGATTLASLAQGTLDAGAERTYTIGWKLDTSSVNADQNTTNSFTLQWDGTPA